MPISIIVGYSCIAYIAKQVHRHPHSQIKRYLLTHLRSAERAFVGGDFYSMMHFYRQISASLGHS